MKNMIISTIQVKMADPEKTLGVLENFKKAQDIPCEHIDISAIDDEEIYELRIQYPLYVFDESGGAVYGYFIWRNAVYARF